MSSKMLKMEKFEIIPSEPLLYLPPLKTEF